MRNGKIFKEFIKYVSFNIMGQLAYSCYTLADTFFVSSALGSNGLAALNLAFPVLCFINGTGLMIGIGGGTKFTVSKIRGEKDKANRVFTNSVYLVLVFSVLFFLSGVFLSDKIVCLLGADDTIFTMTNTYLQTMLFFAPAFLINNLLQCFVRNDGSPSLSMAAMITGSFSNVVLDYIFVFPLDMGIFGAILATGLAPVISIMVLSPYIIKRKNNFHLTKCLPDIRRLFGIISGGVPAFVTEASSGVTMLVFNSIILRLAGNVGVAAYGIVAAVSLVVVAIYTGLSQGIQPIISKSHGLGNKSDVKAIRRYSFITVVLLSAVIYSSIFFGAQPIAAVFNSEHNEVLQQIAVTGLKIYFISCPFVGFNIITSTCFASTENPKPANIISILRGFIIIIPMAFLMSALFKMLGVWLAFPLTEFVAAVIGAVLFKYGSNKQI
ncbi:MAG: MATE family efflux transporter [Eubacterium sp.]|nr:MATE family efflux transporter [Eubacterium sp.]